MCYHVHCTSWNYPIEYYIYRFNTVYESVYDNHILLIGIFGKKITYVFTYFLPFLCICNCFINSVINTVTARVYLLVIIYPLIYNLLLGQDLQVNICSIGFVFYVTKFKCKLSSLIFFNLLLKKSANLKQCSFAMNFF